MPELPQNNTRRDHAKGQGPERWLCPSEWPLSHAVPIPHPPESPLTNVSSRGAMSPRLGEKLAACHSDPRGECPRLQESDRRGGSRTQRTWNDGREGATAVFNEQCCNYSLRLFSGWSLSFQLCLCNRKGNVDSKFHALTTHTKKKPEEYNLQLPYLLHPIAATEPCY